LRIADQGCGMLRNTRLLAAISRELFLVDTDAQLNSVHTDGELRFTIADAASEMSSSRLQVHAVTAAAFSKSRLRLDAIFCVAVMDVVPKKVRRSIIQSAASNLGSGSYFVLIVPRNDSSILKRCNANNRYQDGFIFQRPGRTTFYRNFLTSKALLTECSTVGLSVIRDISNYRQVGILFVRT